MPKRKDALDNDSSDGEPEIINVDFDFFDPIESDFLAIKRLLAQTFQADSELLHVHDLTELLLQQNSIGTTVKIDGKEGDPYAFLTVVNTRKYEQNPAIKAMLKYSLDKFSDDDALSAHLKSLLEPTEPSSLPVGLLISERLINMPVQVVPHMYRMLLEEIQQAGEDYKFSHYLLFTRTYHLDAEDEASINFESSRSDGPPTKIKKKTKKLNAEPAGGVFSYHPEDECIQRHASFTRDFAFTNKLNIEHDAFAVKLALRMMVIPASAMLSLVDTLSQTYAVEL